MWRRPKGRRRPCPNGRDGEWNWWLPGFLGWIPRITIEGEPEAILGAAQPTLDSDAAGA